MRKLIFDTRGKDESNSKMRKLMFDTREKDESKGIMKKRKKIDGKED